MEIALSDHNKKRVSTIFVYVELIFNNTLNQYIHCLQQRKRTCCGKNLIHLVFN